MSDKTDWFNKIFYGKIVKFLNIVINSFYSFLLKIV